MDLAFLLEHFHSHEFNDRLDDTLLNRLATSLLCKNSAHNFFHQHFSETVIHQKGSQKNQGDQVRASGSSLLSWLESLLGWLKELHNTAAGQHEHSFALVRVLIAVIKRQLPELHKDKESHRLVLLSVVDIFHYIFSAPLNTSLDRELFPAFLENLNLLFSDHVPIEENKRWDEVGAEILSRVLAASSSGASLSQQVVHSALNAVASLLVAFGVTAMPSSVSFLESMASGESTANLCCEFLFMYLPRVQCRECPVSSKALDVLLSAHHNDVAQRESLFLLFLLSHCPEHLRGQLPSKLPSWIDEKAALTRPDLLENIVYRVAMIRQLFPSFRLRIFERSATDSWSFLRRLGQSLHNLLHDLHVEQKPSELRRMARVMKYLHEGEESLESSLCNKIVCETFRSYSTFVFPSDFVDILQYLTVPQEALQSVVERCLVQASSISFSKHPLKEAFLEAFVNFLKRNKVALLASSGVLSTSLNLLQVDDQSKYYCEALRVFSEDIEPDLKYLVKCEHASLERYVQAMACEVLSVHSDETLLFLLRLWCSKDQSVAWKSASTTVLEMAKFVQSHAGEMPSGVSISVICLLLTLEATENLPSEFSLVQFLSEVLPSIQEYYAPPLNVFLSSHVCNEMISVTTEPGRVEWSVSMWMFVEHFAKLEDTFVPRVVLACVKPKVIARLDVPLEREEVQWRLEETISDFRCDACGESVEQLLEDILIAREQPSKLDCVGD